MKLRTAINIIRFATVIAGLLALLSIVMYFSIFKDPSLIIIWGSIFLVSIGVSLSKAKWTQYILTRVKYPGILYGVCDSMNLFRNLNINASDQVLDDLYKPAYDTNTFLQDNNLNNEVYRVAISSSPWVTIGYLLPLAVSFFLIKTGLNNFATLSIGFICSLFLTQLITGYLRRRKAPQSDPIYTFSPLGLQTTDALIVWSNIITWEIEIARSQNSRQIINNGRTFLRLDLTEPVNEQKTYLIAIEEIATSGTNFNMLIMHYKYKYGYTSEI